MVVFYLVLAVFAGGMLPLQAATNARLADSLGGPVWAAALSGLVLTIVLTLEREPWRSAPRWPGCAPVVGVDWRLLRSRPALGSYGPDAPAQCRTDDRACHDRAGFGFDRARQFRPCRPGAATLEPQTRNRRRITNNRSGSDALKRRRILPLCSV
jgi:predicted component of type VI protein secretion system